MSWPFPKRSARRLQGDRSFRSQFGEEKLETRVIEEEQGRYPQLAVINLESVGLNKFGI